MVQTARFVVLVFMLLLVMPVAADAESRGGETLTVRISRERLTLTAERVPLRRILDEISLQGDISLRFQYSPDDAVSADLREIPLKMGLKKLLRNYNHAFIYEGAGDGDAAVIRGIFIFSKTGQGAINLVWRPEVAQNHTPVFTTSDTGILIHSQVPGDTDPRKTMRGVDPLARMPLPVDNTPFPENPLISHAHETNLMGPGHLPKKAQGR